MATLNYEIRGYAEGFGEGLWLFLNNELCRGYTTESIERLGFTAESVREGFTNEVAFFGGHLIDVETNVFL